jgi:hypothetical protein
MGYLCLVCLAAALFATCSWQPSDSVECMGQCRVENLVLGIWEGLCVLLFLDMRKCGRAFASKHAIVHRRCRLSDMAACCHACRLHFAASKKLDSKKEGGFAWGLLPDKMVSLVLSVQRCSCWLRPSRGASPNKY